MIVSNKSIMIYAGAVLAFIVIGVGFSYAFFSNSRVDDTSNDALATASHRLVYSDHSEIVVSALENNQTFTKEITVTNSSSMTTTYNLIWSDIQNGFSNRRNLTYKIACLSYNEETESGICPELTEHMSPASAKERLIMENISILPNVTHKYTITFTTGTIEGLASFDGKIIIGTDTVTDNINGDAIQG